MTEYHEQGLNLTATHVNMINNAAEKNSSVVLRLAQNNLQGDHKLSLTQTQIAKIKKAKKLNKGMNLTLSVAQLAHLKKTGGLIPLLALLPILFKGLTAAGAAAVGVASAVSAANNAKA